MANDITDAVMLSNFEDGALLEDDLISTNWNENTGNYSGTVTADTTAYMQGAASAKFYATTINDIIYAPPWLTLADGDLPSNFPGKTTGDSFTVCFWKRVSISTNSTLQAGPSRVGKYVWEVKSDVVDGDVPTFNLQLLLRVPNLVWCTHASTLSVNTWYHIAATYDGTTGNYRLSLATAGGTVGTDVTGTTATMIGSAAAMSVYGHSHGAANASPLIQETLTQTTHIDELAVWTSALTTDDIGDIRSGVYGGGAPDPDPEPDPDMPTWPATRPTDYDPDLAWQPGTWVWGSGYVATGGGRWHKQLVALGNQKVYYEERT